MWKAKCIPVFVGVMVVSCVLADGDVEPGQAQSQDPVGKKRKTDITRIQIGGPSDDPLDKEFSRLSDEVFSLGANRHKTDLCLAAVAKYCWVASQMTADLLFAGWDEIQPADLSLAIFLLGEFRIQSAPKELVGLLERGALPPEDKEAFLLSDDLRERIVKALAQIGPASIHEILGRIETAESTVHLHRLSDLLLKMEEPKKLITLRVQLRAEKETDENKRANLQKATEYIGQQ